MNDHGSDSPEPDQSIFFVAADASSKLRQLLCFGVKSTSITWPPDVSGDFPFKDKKEVLEPSVRAESIPVSVPVSVYDSELLESSSKFLSLV